jgi:chromosome segregation ATPase
LRLPSGQEKAALQVVCNDRAVDILSAHGEVARAREARVAAEERVAAIGLVNKDLLGQLSLVSKQLLDATAEARTEQGKLHASLDAARNELAERELAHGENMKRSEKSIADLNSRLAATDKEKGDLFSRITLLEAGGEAQTRRLRDEKMDYEAKFSDCQHQLAEAMADQAALRTVGAIARVCEWSETCALLVVCSWRLTS